MKTMNDNIQTYRHGILHDQELTPPKKPSRWPLWLAALLFAAGVSLMVFAVIQDIVDHRRKSRCEAVGQCDVGKAAWLQGQCVCVVPARMP